MQNQFRILVRGFPQLLVQKSSTRWRSFCYLLSVISYLISHISYLLSLIFYLLSYFILRWLLYTKNNQWRVQILHTYFQGTSHIPTSTILCHFNIVPCCLAMTAKQHGRKWKWIPTEQFRNLQESGTCNIYVSGTKIEKGDGTYRMVFVFCTGDISIACSRFL